MADKEIVGRCTCPICGAVGQDVRVNINSKLYVYCDSGCAFKFNSAQSRHFLPELRAGRNVKTVTGILITSTKEVKYDRKSDNGTNTGIEPRRWMPGTPAINNGRTESCSDTRKRTWLGNLLRDDNDE